MSNKDKNSGCVLPIVIVCAIIAIIMAGMYVLKGVGGFAKENPGGFFAILVVIVIIGVAWLRSE